MSRKYYNECSVFNIQKSMLNIYMQIIIRRENQRKDPIYITKKKIKYLDVNLLRNM